MKVIRHRLPPFRTEPLAKKKKKALLIGISYGDGKGSESSDPALIGPHQDVMQMKELIISQYGYREEDIVVMLDKEEYGNLQPTRANIIREINNLVKDAKSGDKFVFHYCGHAEQVANRQNSEEDGMDECLVPTDVNDDPDVPKLITDNELRRRLVDPLPLGSKLTAIFDSCHSASLLDLEHFRCNRVFVPWISKGKRKSDSMWNANVRRQGIVTSCRVYRSKRMSTSNVRIKRTTIDQLINQPELGKRLTVKTKSLSLKSQLGRVQDPEASDDDDKRQPWSPIQRCTSPDSLWPCTGSCPPVTDEQPDVVSVAACKDSQLSWEDERGASMTTALIRTLRENPHLTRAELMARISHHLYNLTRELHGQSRDYKKQLKKYYKKKDDIPEAVQSTVAQLETDNFQNPQLASHKPLDMEAKFSL